MMTKILVKIDYFIYSNYHYLPVKYWYKFGFPSKRLLNYCFSSNHITCISGKVLEIAHMYTYDSNINENNLDLIKNVYYNGSVTRERIRQVLAKFVRTYYK